MFSVQDFFYYINLIGYDKLKKWYFTDLPGNIYIKYFMHFAVRELPPNIGVRSIKDKGGNGYNMNEVDEKKNTPLHYAATLGHFEIARALIENGARVDTQGKHDRSPLQLACLNGHVDVVKLLIENYACINLKDDRGLTALHIAVDEHEADIVKVLLEHGANLDAKDEFQMTALHYAAKLGLVEISNILIKEGASVYAKDHNDYSPLVTAAINGPHLDVIEILTKQMRKIEILTKEVRKNSRMHDLTVRYGPYGEGDTDDESDKHL